MDIQAAVDRLNALLPLTARQDQLPAELKVMHLYILSALVGQGSVPDETELIEVSGEENIVAALQRLAEQDLVVLDNQGRRPVGAYPVTLEMTPHRLSVNGQRIFAMCAIEALAVAPMFDREVRIESVCHASRTSIYIHMRGGRLLDVQPTPKITVGVRWQTPTSVAAHSLCMEMVFFKDKACAVEWQAGDCENVSLFTLPEAVEFAKGFFLPLVV